MYPILFAIFILLVLLIFLIKTAPVEKQDIVVVNNVPPPRRSLDPEFRGPPLKRYKPRHFQQMGLLINGSGSTLPLYGRESRTHRDRYHYYTTTPGDQIYPLPITFEGRDCTDDIGCPEFYGNETLSVTGQSGTFTSNIYRTENFMEFY